MNGSVPIFHKMTALDTFSWYDVLTWNSANSCPNAQSEFAIPQENIDLHKQINKAHNNRWTVLQFYLLVLIGNCAVALLFSYPRC